MDQHAQQGRERSRDHSEMMRRTSGMVHSQSTGAWGNMSASVRPSTTIAAPCTGGGRTQGAKHLRPHTTGLGDYDASKHGWYDPRGQDERVRLTEPSEPGSWAWTMRKARDHVGYGDDGVVNWGDVQCSAVSGDTPDWFVGSRTLPGPYGTRKHPVRRCPVVEIDGKQMRIRAKTYGHGPGLSVTETLHETQKPCTPMAKSIRDGRVPEKNRDAHVATRSNLEMGGCQTVHRPLPASLHKTQEAFNPQQLRRPLQTR